jgi:DNA primase
MGLIPEETITQVLDRCDIVEVVSEYLALKKMGRNFKACCPFHHEKTPSFVVNRDKQIYHCFGCGVGGNVISFVMNHDHMDFPSALRHLAQKAGVPVPEATSGESIEVNTGLREILFKVNEGAAGFFHDVLVAGKSGSQGAQEYLKNRGIKLAMVQKLKIGFAPESWDSLITFLRGKNISLSVMEKAGLIIPKEKGDGFYDRFRDRIMFPIFDVRSRCLGFGARTMEKNASAKYINSPETMIYSKREHLYGLHLSKQAVSQKDCVVVVEGYMDFLTPFQAGFEHIVASLGTALTSEQIRLLRRYTKNVVMLYDADAAGQSATLRSLDLLIEEDMNVKIALLASGEDPDSFVQKFGMEEFGKRIDNAQSFFDYKVNALMQKHDRKTPEGKARISAEMLSTIVKYKNEIIRQEYIRQLAHVLGISEDALRVELKKINTPTVKEASGVVARRDKNVVRAVERDLLKLMIEEQHMIPMVQEEVRLDDFQDSQVRSVVEYMFDLCKKEKIVNINHLVQCFKDQETLQFLSELAASGEMVVEDKDGLRQDYINRIKGDRLKLERKNLCYEIQKAELEKDHARLEELKQKFHQLMKG